MHTCIHTYIRTYVHTYVRTYIHAYIHTYIHTYVYDCMGVYQILVHVRLIWLIQDGTRRSICGPCKALDGVPSWKAVYASRYAMYTHIYISIYVYVHAQFDPVCIDTYILNDKYYKVCIQCVCIYIYLCMSSLVCICTSVHIYIARFQAMAFKQANYTLLWFRHDSGLIDRRSQQVTLCYIPSTVFALLLVWKWLIPPKTATLIRKMMNSAI